MKKLFLTLLTIAFCTVAYSQTVETIRKDYNYHGRFGWGLYVRDAYWRKNISFMDFLD